MQSDDCIWELEVKIFTASFYGKDPLAFGSSCEVGGGLRFCGDWVKDVDIGDLLALHQRAQCLCDGFYFGQFGHSGLRSVRITKMVSELAYVFAFLLRRRR